MWAISLKLKSISIAAILLFIIIHPNDVFSQITNNDIIPEVGLPEVVVSSLRLPFKESTIPYGISLINARNNMPGLSLAENLVQAQYALLKTDQDKLYSLNDVLVYSPEGSNRSNSRASY